MMIGIIGVGTDIVLGLFGRWLFPWSRSLIKKE
jgi:NitT/TauT family transport system permease protein